MGGWDWTAIGVVVAAVMGGITIWQVSGQHRRAERREELARDERQKLREEDQAAKQGRPSTAPEVLRVSDARRAYQFRVTNVGSQTLLDLEPFLVDDDGQVCSEPLASFYLDPLNPKDSLNFELAVRDDATDRNPLRLRYKYLSWDTHLEHTSGVAVPAD
jgi:hypothetical protein